MDYTYEILDFVPVDSRAKVVFEKEGSLPYYKLFTLASFDPEEVKQQIREFAPVVFNHWEKADAAPSESPLKGKQSEAYQKIKEWREVEPEPITDPLKQKHVEDITETEDELIYTQRVVPLTAEEQADVAKMNRDWLLIQTDKFALADRTISKDMLAYRQALRDVPSQERFPKQIDWPTPPEA